eukprot:scaffold11216_cov126-Isochrysis_galbana.AAC.1
MARYVTRLRSPCGHSRREKTIDKTASFCTTCRQTCTHRGRHNRRSASRPGAHAPTPWPRLPEGKERGAVAAWKPTATGVRGRRRGAGLPALHPRHPHRRRLP